MNTIEISGITYNIVSVKNFQHNGKTREALTLRRPNGSRLYHAVRYETGSVSSAV